MDDISADDVPTAPSPSDEPRSLLPRGVERLAPYATLKPSTVLDPISVTYKSRQDKLATVAAKSQLKRTQWKEKRAAKTLARGKTRRLKKLHGKALWVSFAGVLH